MGIAPTDLETPAVPAADSRKRSDGDRRLRICIVTTARICDNPRVVKEADAFAAAGHTVRVVAYAPVGEAVERDRDVLAGRDWTRIAVDIRGSGGIARRLQWIALGVIGRAAGWLFARGVRTAFVRDRAASKYLPLVARAAAAQEADLLIAHHVPALPAAALAAAKLGAPMAFDAEDLHSGDRPNTAEFATELALARAVEEAYLPRCVVTTAASEGIAEALVARYRVARPHVVLNTFPASDTQPSAGEGERPLSLYWYSQVVGLDRGLQDVIGAMGRVPHPVALHLRGQVDGATREALLSLAASVGMERAVHFHPLAAPTRLLDLAGEHDVGLALEQPTTENRLVCVTNKLLAYLTAGLAVIATDLPGQRGIVETIPDAGRLYAPGDVEGLARAIASFAADRPALERAKAAARAAAVTQYNWELDAPRLVETLASAARDAARARAR